MEQKWIAGGVTAPEGFYADGISCGVKVSGKPDLGIVYSQQACKAYGVFTKNVIQSPAVQLDRKRVQKGSAYGVIVNSGNANACTGKQGMRDAEEMARLTEKGFSAPAGSFLVSSTGIIGHKMPMNIIRSGIKTLSARKVKKNAKAFAASILTTDKVRKEAAIRLRFRKKTITIGGACKGSGMIHPNMATMLAFITTDANVPKKMMDGMFKRSVNKSFNRISVDGDSSTNDSVLMLANGTAGNAPFTKKEKETFEAALTDLMVRLAKMIAADGEGATKLVEVNVNGAASQEDAERAARSIANSPLVKTALFGNDPNWGRILCAAGYSGARFNPECVNLKMCGVSLVRKGRPVAFNPKVVSRKMKAKELVIELSLGKGAYAERLWTCDFSYDYVRINAEYHT